MLLFVKDGCRLCKQVEKYKEVELIRVKATGRGPKMDVKGVLMDLPSPVKALPSLLDGEHLFVGEGAVMAHLKKVFGE